MRAFPNILKVDAAGQFYIYTTLEDGKKERPDSDFIPIIISPLKARKERKR